MSNNENTIQLIKWTIQKQTKIQVDFRCRLIQDRNKKNDNKKTVVESFIKNCKFISGLIKKILEAVFFWYSKPSYSE